MKTLLIVDDELVVLRLLGCVLKKQYIVLEATTAEEARRLFIEHRHAIDLLVADLTLPESSGAEVALSLRSLAPRLPVILTSGYPLNTWSEENTTALNSLGPDLVTILQKPFAPEALLNAVQELVEYPRSEMARTA